ncbi:MAG: type I-E CRISPR-associated protein Cas7/Cse4/CasC, partial [Candidatus Lokiarchaeota archaeon]|nr:type I-E CRISPR-associated protein Cas7/Cse4/CasC [Candidatus Lokiarchaeota archaeon]
MIKIFVELHLIQNFGPSCLNRDDTNTPKDCQFGGYRRARISSQCFKRAMREYLKSESSKLNGTLGVRTRMLPKKIIEILVEKGKNEDTAADAVKKVLKKIGFETDKKKEKTDVLLFLNNDLPEKIAKLMLDNWAAFSGKKISKDDEKKLNPIKDEIKNELNPDIALFGRMVASKTDLKVDAACYVAHAISTHKVDMEMDFYTALDDLQGQTESGAGMMGITLYNSSCFYRYLVLDFEQLVDNLQQDKEFAVSVLKEYIKASINAIPTGKQTSMAAFSKPDFIMATIRSGQPWSLVNAFTRPVKVGL